MRQRDEREREGRKHARDVKKRRKREGDPQREEAGSTEEYDLVPCLFSCSPLSFSSASFSPSPFGGGGSTPLSSLRNNAVCGSSTRSCGSLVRVVASVKVCIHCLSSVFPHILSMPC